MSNVRDSDTSLWLHNKLGSNEPWTSGSITSQLNVEVLRNIKECFIDLQTQVKLKLLLSFFHIPKRSIDEWKIELEEILEVAQADSEQWVGMIAEILKSFPITNCLHIEITEPEENRRIFYDLAEEVTKDMKRGHVNLLPIECHYLNKSALNSVVTPQKQITKHFNQRAKMKSVILRKELLERATDAAKHTLKKIPAPTIPLRTRGMPRKMTDTTPLKGIPSVNSGAKTPGTPGNVPNTQRTPTRTAPEKKGGIKMLDITEQPVGYAQSKRRRKAHESDESKKNSQGEDGSLGLFQTPDYAAGLPMSVRVSSPPPTPSPYVPPLTPNPQNPLISPSSMPMTPNPSFPHQSSIPEGPPPTPNPTISPKKISSPIKTQNQQPKSDVPVESIPPAQPPNVQTMTKTVILQVPNNHQPSNSFQLSKELMDKASEIFRTANRATRPEKEHILKFMAGTRENPCPELGNIVTIKLSEREESVTQNDTLIRFSVETHFQMNYVTGEWKVITKPPKVIKT